MAGRGQRRRFTISLAPADLPIAKQEALTSLDVEGEVTYTVDFEDVKGQDMLNPSL